MKAAPLPQENPDGPFLRTLLMFLARADGPMSADGWLCEPLTLDDINRAVTAYNCARLPINAAISAQSEDDDAGITSSVDGLAIVPFDGRIELARDGTTRVLLTPGRKATVYLEELRLDEVAGGFRLWSPESLELAVDKADAPESPAQIKRQ